jgi:hypothetical protein
MVTIKTAPDNVIVIESRRHRRDDEPTQPDDVTLPDVHDDSGEEGERECERAST